MKSSGLHIPEMIGAANLAEMQPLSPTDPPTVGEYVLLGRLGSGGMGRVFLGRSASGRRVAVKLIRPELADDPVFRTRFAREVEAARAVSGFFTAPVVDADPDAEQPWLATGYIPAPDLRTTVEGSGPLDPAAVRGLAIGLAEALRAIHQAQVVHRDLKPSNILLAPDGPRVIDFGIARALDATALTRDGSIGTVHFMAPEQIHADGDRTMSVGPACDVFALGGTLVYASTGRPPFGDGPTEVVLHRILNDAPDLSHVPPELSGLIRACLSRQPADRPTPQDIVTTLSGQDAPTMVLRTTPTLPPPVTRPMAGPPPTPRSGLRWSDPRVILASIGMAMAFVLVAALGLIGLNNQRSRLNAASTTSSTTQVVAVPEATTARPPSPTRAPSRTTPLGSPSPTVSVAQTPTSYKIAWRRETLSDGSVRLVIGDIDAAPKDDSMVSMSDYRTDPEERVGIRTVKGWWCGVTVAGDLTLTSGQLRSDGFSTTCSGRPGKIRHEYWFGRSSWSGFRRYTNPQRTEWVSGQTQSSGRLAARCPTGRTGTYDYRLTVELQISGIAVGALSAQSNTDFRGDCGTGES